MQPLQSVGEHRAVVFLKDVAAHLDRVVGSNAKEEAVERRMVQLAESDAVLDDGLPARLSVGDDVRGVQEFVVPQPAQRALLPIRFEHSLPEAALVQALPHEGRDVLPAPRVLRLTDGETLRFSPRVGVQVLLIIHSDIEHQSLRVIADDEDRPHRHILAGHEPVEVDERRPLKHRCAEAGIFMMMRVCSPVAVQQQTVRAQLIAVWTVRSRGDRERYLRKDLGLEDALLGHEWNPLPVKLEPVQEQAAGEHVTVLGHLPLEPAEGREADAFVVEVCVNLAP